MCQGVLTNTHMCVYSWDVLIKTLTHVSISPWDGFCHLPPLFHTRSLEVGFGFSRMSQEDCGGACKEAKILKTALIGRALTLR